MMATDDNIIKQLKSDIVEQIDDFIENNLVNHRKKDAGLVSLQNTLLADIKSILDYWKRY